MLNTMRSALMTLAVAYKRLTSAELDQLARLASSNHASRAAFAADRSFLLASVSTNRRRVRRAIILMSTTVSCAHFGRNSNWQEWPIFVRETHATMAHPSDLFSPCPI